MIHAKASLRWQIPPNSLEPEMKKAFKEGWQECADFAVEEARKKAPSVTGQLRDSIEASQISYTGFRLICKVDYGIFIELGTRDHWVEPIRKKALHWEEDGEDRFSKGHMVSGITAKPFIQPTMYQNVKKFENIITKHFADLR